MPESIKDIRVCNVDEEGRFGGPERRIVQVAQALKAHGVESIIIFPVMDSAAFEGYIREHDVASIKLDITRLTLQKKILLRYLLRFFSEILSLRRAFKRARCELVHVNGAYQFKVAIAARMAGIPVIWHLNDTYAPALLKSVFAMVAGRCASAFIVAGERVREYYLSGTTMDRWPCEEVHAPVNLEVFDPERFAKTPSAENKPLRIGTVSSVNPAKGLEYFVEVAARVLERYPHTEIVVAGAVLESQRAYYASVLSRMDALGLDRDRIRFAGLVGDVPAFLSELDICLFTSVTEASPTSVWEAMAMAKPVVTTDAGSVRQYIENGVSGFVAPVGDVEQLSSCVIRCMEDAKLRTALGLAARQVAIRELGVEAAAMRTNRIYRSIAADFRKG